MYFFPRPKVLFERRCMIPVATEDLDSEPAHLAARELRRQGYRVLLKECVSVGTESVDVIEVGRVQGADIGRRPVKVDGFDDPTLDWTTQHEKLSWLAQWSGGAHWLGMHAVCSLIFLLGLMCL